MFQRGKQWALLLICVALQCPLNASWAAESFQISPLPLAKNAKPKPDEFPEELARRKRNEIYVQANVLLGSHQFIELDRLADKILQQYLSKQITADAYVEDMEELIPAKAGKGLLDDVKEWTQSAPRSYAAWYVLGGLYYDIAWQERGNKYANATSAEQFKAMGDYATLARAAYLKSLEFSKRAVPSYAGLISVATILPRDESQLESSVKMLLKGSPKEAECSWEPKHFSAYNAIWNEQLTYLCKAWRIEPNATRPFKQFVVFNSPRWGGSYKPLDDLFASIWSDPRLSAAARGTMQATLFKWKAKDIIDKDPHRAAEFYRMAFEASPTNENVDFLYKAAYIERDKTKDSLRALALWQQIVAFRPNDYTAIFEIGFVYQDRGDLKRYMEQMIEAGKLGMLEAQNNIGYYYMVGQRGLPKNLYEARAWLTLSADQGFEHAREKLKLLNDMIAKEGGK